MKYRILFMTMIFSMIGGFALANSFLFRDVPSGFWGYQAIRAVTDMGIMKGFDDGTFKPDSYVTRAELAQIVFNQQEVFKQELLKMRSEENQAIQSVSQTMPSVVMVSRPPYQGTGFFVDSKHILTAYHVVEGDKKVQVKTFLGSSFDAEVIGFNEERDLALLEVHIKEQVKSVKFRSQASAGQTVFTIGHPPGFSYTVSRGIVSTSDRGYEGKRYIQFDTPINFGNSGGPIIDLQGNVVGIVVQKVMEFHLKDSEKVPINGIGLGVHIDEIKEFLRSHHIDISGS